jgi:hypothetical protein
MSTATVEMELKEREYRHDLFQRHVSAFIERYAPRSYEGRDFEHELRNIIQMAYEEAQRPFVYELNTYRQNIVDSSMIKPLSSKVP